jgi:phage I-like protein
MPNKTSLKPLIAACLVALDKSAAQANAAVQLFPSGEIHTPKGSLLGQGPWRLDAASAAQLIAATRNQANAILIDYEHQSLSSAQNGQPAPAAGWIDPASLLWRDACPEQDRMGGLFAVNPAWTEKAAAMIAADEYRYLSPVFTYDPKTGAPLKLLSVALTNTPAIDGMAQVALAAAMAGFETLETELPHVDKELLILLGLAENATPAAVTQAVAALKAKADAAEAKDAQIAALKAAPPDPARFVPIEAFLALRDAQRQSDAAGREQQVAALIAAHPDVIIPALVPWATELGKKDLAALREYIGKQTPIAALTATQTGGKAPSESSATPTGSDAAVMKALGLTAEQFAAGKLEA